MTTEMTFGAYLSDAGELPEASFMGLLVMYSFAGARHANITQQAMDQVFARHGLNPIYVPAKPTQAQAFANATGEKRQRYEYLLDGVRHFAEIKAVGSDRDTITRAVWAFRVGDDKKGLDGREVGTITFYKASGGGSARLRYQLENAVLKPGERDLLTDFLQEVDTDYQWYSDYLYDQPIRQAVMRYIETGLNGIKVLTSGGCYFVHRRAWTELRSLHEAITELSPSFSLTMCPIPDLPNLRDMLIDAFENAAEADVIQLVQKIAERRKGGRVTPTMVQEFGEQVRMIQARAEEHSRIFNVAQDKSANALEIAWEAISGLVESMEASA